MMSPAEQERLSEVQVINDLLRTNEQALPAGLLDPAMGVCSKDGVCKTCGKNLELCPGHWGFIRLALPVYNLGYIKHILETLQAICKTCGRVLLTAGERAPYLAKFRSKKTDKVARDSLKKSLLTKCKKVEFCPHCGAANGTVKKVGPSKIIHELYSAKKKSGGAASDQLRADCEDAIMHNREVGTLLERAFVDLNAKIALDLFKKMTAEDIESLDMDPINGPPERFIFQSVPVPPICIRPTVCSDGPKGTTEDDLTAQLRWVVAGNKLLQAYMAEGESNIGPIVTAWEGMQDQLGLYINSNIPGLLQKSEGGDFKPIRSLCSRLKGKHGRFRGNLCGKRVNFSARSVISPDPNLNVWEVGVPIDVAKEMTYPERVTRHNIDYLRQLVLNGPDVHPGANYIVSRDGMYRTLRVKREDAAMKLQYGDIVERHMRDGDIVLFNRQPSLHRISIMCHRARIFPFRTFRFNESVCTPYNADFDGDEMNLHLPQTEEARAEAMELMEVTKNLVTPRTGDMIVASTQDFLTTGYLITRKDTFYDRSHFMQICTYANFASEQIDIPPPAILKPAVLWTGKQAIKSVIKPNNDTNILLNMETKAKTFSVKDGSSPFLCPSDGYVCFRNSELMCGTLDKATLGGSKNCIWHVLMREYGTRIAGAAMSRLARLSARWIGEHGFSIGISDVTPSARLTARKAEILANGDAECEELIRKAKTGELELQAGMDMEGSLECIMTGKLSNVREEAGKMCMSELHYNNSVLIMCLCGSKGSNINISQMIACVGQQVVSGTRIPDGFIRRSLPHFHIDAKEPRAKGFVANSFFTGLTPEEFFFHTMGGREGLVDSAVKTAETGYMQRRLMKALEDLRVVYDLSVRNSEDKIVQFMYGEDDLDPSFMEAADKPVNFPNVFLNITNQTYNESEPALMPYEIREMTEEMIKDPRFEQTTERFRQDLREFLIGSDGRSGVCGDIATLRKQYRLDPALDRPDGEEDGFVPLLSAADQNIMQMCVNKIKKLTKKQLVMFIDTCYKKYTHAVCEPGTAVGALAAQSLGEPSTQMTLKTFHFAGVASMNVSLGVPRIKEVINATKAIATPVITASLVADQEVQSARIVKGRIEQTLLGEIVDYIREIYVPERCYIRIKIDATTISKLQLECNAATMVAAICNDKEVKRLQIKPKNVTAEDELHISITPPTNPKKPLFFTMHHLKDVLPRVVVAGIPGIRRAVINQKNDSTYNILVEGQELTRVMGVTGIDGRATECNHVMVIEQTLGIEAARTMIMKEIVNVLSNYGISIDTRHTMLLADCMTFKGCVLGITRFGISKMRESVLMLASFERMTDFLFDAGSRSRVDNVQGVSESIICGVPVNLGTGLFKVMQKVAPLKNVGARPTALQRMKQNVKK